MFNFENCNELARRFKGVAIPCIYDSGMTVASNSSPQSNIITGAHINLPNNWTVSIQWSQGSYCSNRHQNPSDSCSNAEIAAWDRDGKWYDFETDTVKGYCTFEEVEDFVSEISRRKK